MREKREIFNAWEQPLRASPRTPPPSAPNSGSLAAYRAHDRAICAAVPAGKIAFLRPRNHLLWPEEHPKNADSSSAFAADIRGRLKK